MICCLLTTVAIPDWIGSSGKMFRQSTALTNTPEGCACGMPVTESLQEDIKKNTSCYDCILQSEWPIHWK